MSDSINQVTNDTARRTWPIPAVFAIAVLVSLPFWIGTGMLAWDAAHLPAKAGNLARARCWQSAVFVFGIACGITGAAAALWLKSWRPRALGTAGTLLGFAGVSLSLIMGWYIHRAGAAHSVSLLPFAIPSFLVFAALMVLINSVRFADDSSENQSDDISAEQPQHQSPL